MPREQNDYSPATWRIEYLPPGGAWTLLARETSVPDGSNTLSRTYYTPQGANGTWKMRAVMESDETILGLAPSRLVINKTATITGKTTSKYKKSFHIPLSGKGPWDIRVRKMTPNSAQANLQNQLWWDSIAEIVESKLSYPNSAIVGASVDAEQFSDIPSRGYEIYGILCKIPSNYNPASRIYTGTWDGTFKVQWTNNPAWVFYDLLTNDRYGLGQYIADQNLDKWALYSIARYCDEKVPSGYGYVEPRFTCNCYIQTREDAYKLISNLASVFRGMAYWSAGQVTAVADMPSDAISIFTNANVDEEGFNYTGSSRSVRHTVALVTWNDPSDRYRQKVEYVDDRDGISKYGINPTEVVAFGCTSRGQAHRLGKWLLYTELLETDMVAFKTGLEGVSVYPGAIIKIADTLRSGTRIGGRSRDADLNSITLDAPVTLSSGVKYTVSVVLPSGKVVDRNVTNVAGETSILTVSPALTETPQKHSMWVMASTVLRPQLFRVLSVVESGKASVEITALRHNKNKFAAVEYDQLFEDEPISSISTSAPKAPTALKATDTLYLQGPGVVGTKLHFSWEGRAVRFKVRWKQTGNYEMRETLTGSIDIAPVTEGPMTLQVQGVDALGRTSPWASLDYVVVGKTAPPSDVTGFSVKKRLTDLWVEWNALSDLDLAGYELRVGPSWDAGVVLTSAYMGTTFIHDQSEAGTYYYHVRAIDTSGNYSANVTTFELILKAPVPVSLFDCVQSGDRVEFRWQANPEQDIACYEIREGVEWGFSTLLGQVSATTYSTPAGAGGVRNFLIKAIGSPGIYADIAAFVNTSVALPTNRNIVWGKDLAVLNYPGVQHNVTQVTNFLLLDPSKSRGEYIFEVDMGAPYRGQITQTSAIDAVKPVVDWKSAGFSWSSETAKHMRWINQGDNSSAGYEIQFAQHKGLAAGETEGWTLNNTLASLNGVAPSSAIKVSYGEGRYNSGVKVGDTTSVAWDVNIPAVFRHSFWYSPELLCDSTVLRLSGTGWSLAVRYSATKGEMYLEDEMCQRVSVVANIEVGGQYLIVVVQTNTDRKLAVSSMLGGTPTIASKPLVPQGPVTKIALH